MLLPSLNVWYGEVLGVCRRFDGVAVPPGNFSLFPRKFSTAQHCIYSRAVGVERKKVYTLPNLTLPGITFFLCGGVCEGQAGK